MAAQEEKLRQLAEQEQLLAASIAQVIGAADPAVSEAQLGLQRVSPSSFSQLVSLLSCSCSCIPDWQSACGPHVSDYAVSSTLAFCQAALSSRHQSLVVSRR